MLTKQSNKFFSILKNTPDSLILQNHYHKYIRKTFIVKQQSLRQLIQRQKLIHPNLINLHQIQFSHSINQTSFAVDIVFEHYCKTLQLCIKNQQTQWQTSQIINTFEPIVELIDHLLNHNININEFSLNNIVITEDQNIKFLDSFFLNKEIHNVQISKSINNFNDNKIYLKIADIIFMVICPNFSSNCSKTKLKFLKQKSSKQVANFISSILSKSGSKTTEVPKNKKIKKTVKMIKNQNIQQPSYKSIKQDKKQKDGLSTCQINMYAKHQGKQNKLQQ